MREIFLLFPPFGAKVFTSRSSTKVSTFDALAQRRLKNAQFMQDFSSEMAANVIKLLLRGPEIILQACSRLTTNTCTIYLVNIYN